MTASEQDFESIHGIGPETAAAVCKFFSNLENQAIIEAITHSDVIITNEHPPSTDVGKNLFCNKRMVLTGTLQTLTRNDVKRQLEKLGAVVTASISSKTDFLIAGENPGSKLEKAKKLGVEIMNEARLTLLLQEYS
jgi:DNA ligase (NAD+)